MFGSGVLDTAIGLVFVFLLVSLLVTIGNELISAILLSRAKWLRVGIDRLLGSEWAQKLYDHPLIEGSAVVRGSAAPTRWSFRGSGPSYIPSRSFANVLLGLVRDGDSILSEAQKALQIALDGASSTVKTMDELQKQLREVIAGTPSIARNDSIRKDLTGLVGGLQGGTSVGEASKVIQGFIDGADQTCAMSSREYRASASAKVCWHCSTMHRTTSRSSSRTSKSGSTMPWTE